jgi:hypothetical protein
MTTENPKISAYVPQPLFDRFKEYQEASNASMSSAIISILATFFQTDTQGNRTVDIRDFQALEERVKKIEASFQRLDD